jgi:hypothetical protein
MVTRLALTLAALLAITTPGEACHRYSRWAYPWPQKCPPTARHVLPPSGKENFPKEENLLKNSRTVVPTARSDVPSAADLERLRAALILKLATEPRN